MEPIPRRPRPRPGRPAKRGRIPEATEGADDTDGPAAATDYNNELEKTPNCAPAVRDQGFRRAVTVACGRRCAGPRSALGGIRVLTPEGHTAVDAAHVVPWSVSRDDRVGNGMALCRLCHWTFDEGLLGVSGAYLVIASPRLAGSDNVPGHLLTLADRIILGPAERALWPDREALGWHRRKVFLRR